ncbi:MAG: hypothetical protein OXH99_21945 [Bryobacterales bacterium]|nr:hypothetical protein [Bryobacterales bacterium]
MRGGLRILRPESVVGLRQALRGALGRAVCEREEWRNAKGRYCEAPARKALPRLAGALNEVIAASRARLVPIRTASHAHGGCLG